jgi:hypothetical protein
MTTRNASDATTIRTALKACGLSFDDGEIAAPDDGHQKQQDVERSEALSVPRFRGSGVQGAVPGSAFGSKVREFSGSIAPSSTFGVSAHQVHRRAEPRTSNRTRNLGTSEPNLEPRNPGTA